MNFKKSIVAALFVALALLTVPFVVVHGAGGRIEGKVTDPKGAAIVGASVTVTDLATNQKFSAVTDGQGQYKVEGLTPGTYTIVVTAKNFSESRRENVTVTEGAMTPVDLKLEIAAVEANVTVSSGKSNSDSVYQQLRQQGKNEQEFSGPYASVNNLSLRRDAATFVLRTGEIYFDTPVEGRTTGAVFVGDGELTLVPPTANEKRSLALFTDSETLTEQFTHLVIRFTDKTLDEIKSSSSATMGTNGPQAGRARDLYREHQQVLRKELRSNVELRTLRDLYTPGRPGFFNAYIGGKRYSKLIFRLDPQGIPAVSPEEVALVSYGEGDGGIWTAFHLADEYANSTASSSESTGWSISLIMRSTAPSRGRISLQPMCSLSGVWPAALELFRSAYSGRCASVEFRMNRAKT